ncbi:hypothetical protein [Hymenobacter koreensis]|uniref:Tetratricopeptide repeat protein n=1 Tax=Hymenobacter koreensis TaxID=1084523 RepID=A0ABP8JJ14_9BACT
MKKYLLLLLLLPALAAPVAAQKVKTKTKGAGAELPLAARRQLPLFGGLTPEAAQQLMGAAFLKGIDQNFASRTEASQFFARKGYEYINEGQADTARYRFNLAWLLDPKNPEAYRGLGLLASSTALDESIGLFERALAITPASSAYLADLGASYLLRYDQSKKSKDLKAAFEHLQKATTTDPTNAYAFQQLARAHYLQGNYALAWEAVHKGQNLNLTSVDFDFIADLVSKQPDPQGKFK